MFLKIFSERLSELRKANNLSQSELAKAIGKSHDIICSLELGRRTSTPETYIAIAQYFGVSLDYLFGLSDIPNISRTA